MTAGNHSKIMQESTNIFIIRQTETRTGTRIEGRESSTSSVPEKEQHFRSTPENVSKFDENAGLSVATYLSEDEIFWLMSKRRIKEEWEVNAADEGFIDQFLFPADSSFAKHLKIGADENSFTGQNCDISELKKVTEELEHLEKPLKAGNNRCSGTHSQGFPQSDLLDIQTLSTLDRPLERPYSEIFPKVDIPLMSEIFHYRRVKSSSTPIVQSQSSPSSVFMYSELVKAKNMRNGKAGRKTKPKNSMRMITPFPYKTRDKNFSSQHVGKRRIDIPEAGFGGGSGRISRDSAFCENDYVDDYHTHGEICKLFSVFL